MEEQMSLEEYKLKCKNEKIQFDIDTKYRYNAIKRFMRVSERFAKYIRRVFPDLRKLVHNVWHIHRIYKTKLKQYKEEYYNERTKQQRNQSSISRIHERGTQEMLPGFSMREECKSSEESVQSITETQERIERYYSVGNRNVRTGDIKIIGQCNVECRNVSTEITEESYRTVVVDEVKQGGNRKADEICAKLRKGIEESRERQRESRERQRIHAENIATCDRILDFLERPESETNTNNRHLIGNS